MDSSSWSIALERKNFHQIGKESGPPDSLCKIGAQSGYFHEFMQSVVAEVKIRGLGPIPLVFIEDGSILQQAAEWLIYLKQNGRSSSLLFTRAIAISRFYDFFNRYSSQLTGPDPLRLLWQSLRRGDPQLAWEKLNHDRKQRSWRARFSQDL